MVRLLLFVVIFCLSITATYSHVKDRPDLNAYFNALKSGKGTCCSNYDGTTLTDNDWEIRNGKYWVYIPRRPDPANPQMDWVMVPDDAIVTEANKYGPAVVWPTYGALGVDVRCFMPGSMS